MDETIIWVVSGCIVLKTLETALLLDIGKHDDIADYTSDSLAEYGLPSLLRFLPPSSRWTNLLNLLKANTLYFLRLIYSSIPSKSWTSSALHHGPGKPREELNE